MNGRAVRLFPRFDCAAVAAAGALARWGGSELLPPVPVEEIVEAAGFRIVRLTDIADGISGIVSVRDRLIGVNGRHHPHRQRFTLGHELGHILLGHPAEAGRSPEQVRVFDLEADRCASELLMPARLLLPLLQKDCRLPVLARLFDVSPEAMAVRLSRLQPPVPRSVAPG